MHGGAGEAPDVLLGAGDGKTQGMAGPGVAAADIVDVHTLAALVEVLEYFLENDGRSSSMSEKSGEVKRSPRICKTSRSSRGWNCTW